MSALTDRAGQVRRRLGPPRSWARRVDAALVAPGPGYRLVEVQTLLSLLIALRLLGRDWTRIADRPAELTGGLTVVSWLPPLPAAALVVLQVLGVAGVAAVVSRRLPRAGYAVAWSCYTVLTALWGESGKVMHNDVLTVTVGAVLLFASVPGRGRTGDWSPRWGWPPRAALAVLATVYWLTGAQKLRHSGPEWVFSDNMAWVLRQGAVGHGSQVAHWVADHLVVSQLLAGGALALELTAPLWLAIRRTRALFAVAVLLMHTSIWWFLGLDYSAWVLTAAAVAVPMSLRPERRLVDVVRRRPSPPRPGAEQPDAQPDAVTRADDAGLPAPR